MFDLRQDEIEDLLENRVLVRDVAIERHRFETQQLPELAHRQRVDPALVGNLERGANDPLPA